MSRHTDVEKLKFWAHVAAILAVGLTVPAWLGANWVGLFGGVVVFAIGLGVHISRHGYTTRYLWRIDPQRRRMIRAVKSCLRDSLRLRGGQCRNTTTSHS